MINLNTQELIFAIKTICIPLAIIRSIQALSQFQMFITTFLSLTLGNQIKDCFMMELVLLIISPLGDGFLMEFFVLLNFLASGRNDGERMKAKGGSP